MPGLAFGALIISSILRYDERGVHLNVLYQLAFMLLAIAAIIYLNLGISC